MEEVLDDRSLNRALLARQLLLHRADLPALGAIEHLVGMQSQAPNPPFVGLWARLERFDHAELDELMLSRDTVRIALMRSTIHLVSAGDCLALRPILQPVVERTFLRSYAKQLGEIDLAAVAAAARELVEATPLTPRQVGERLADRWPGRDATALGEAARAYLPLVQVPPRGLWRQSGPAAHTTAEHWLGRPLDDDADVDRLVLRYLGAFGPAGAKDVQTWSRLTRVGEVLDRLRPRLLTFRDERGAELFDLPDAPRPGADAPAPARLLPEWDNVLLSHADRSRIISDDARKKVFTINGIISPTLLLDGFVSGVWRIEREHDEVTLIVEPFRRLSKGERAAVTDESERMLALAAADATARRIRLP